MAAEGEKREGGEVADGAEGGFKNVKGEAGERGDTAIVAEGGVKDRTEPDYTGGADHFVKDVDAEKPGTSGDAEKGRGGVAGDQQAHVEDEAPSERGEELQEEGEAEDARDWLRCIHTGTTFLRWARRC